MHVEELGIKELKVLAAGVKSRLLSRDVRDLTLHTFTYNRYFVPPPWVPVNEQQYFEINAMFHFQDFRVGVTWSVLFVYVRLKICCLFAAVWCFWEKGSSEISTWLVKISISLPHYQTEDMRSAMCSRQWKVDLWLKVRSLFISTPD